MLSDQVQTLINKELKKYPANQKQSAVMSALRFVQDEKGWIADSDMADIAAYLGMPQMQVYEVATFYHMYNLKLMGRHIAVGYPAFFILHKTQGRHYGGLLLVRRIFFQLFDDECLNLIG